MRRGRRMIRGWGSVAWYAGAGSGGMGEQVEHGVVVVVIGAWVAWRMAWWVRAWRRWEQAEQGIVRQRAEMSR